MILKGSQRGGSGQLAAHLMNEMDNDHVTLHELRGFVSETLDGALAEMHAVSGATRCKQFMFSLSLNPPKQAACGIDELVEAANRAEAALGLTGQPRGIVVHEKEGRRHIHVVWSRIDVKEMKAVPMPFFKNRLAALSKELYLHHGWDLPDGHKENGWKNPLNFTLAEWQQAKRVGQDPREVKLIFRESWRQSDNLTSFRNALEEKGFYLAHGRRGFVAVDLHGEVYSVPRETGIRTKEVTVRLGSPDALPSVEQVISDSNDGLNSLLRRELALDRARQDAEARPIRDERAAMIDAQRREREELVRLQEVRRRLEIAVRQARFRKGIRGLWDVLTGRAAEIRRQNERQALDDYQRDMTQRELLFAQQVQDRQHLQARLEELAALHRKERMDVASHLHKLLDRNFLDGGIEEQRSRRVISLDLH